MTTRNKYVVFMIFVVVALGVAACFVIATKQPQQSTPAAMSQTVQGLDSNKLPSDFVFVKDKSHHYYLYRDMSNFYLVWQDDTFANSVHITWLGPVAK